MEHPQWRWILRYYTCISYIWNLLQDIRNPRFPGYVTPLRNTEIISRDNLVRTNVFSATVF